MTRRRLDWREAGREVIKAERALMMAWVAAWRGRLYQAVEIRSGECERRHERAKKRGLLRS